MEQITYEIDYEPGSMIDQWVKEGIEQGQITEREKNVKRMVEKGFTVDQIVDILGVSKEFVLKVKQKYEL